MKKAVPKGTAFFCCIVPDNSGWGMAAFAGEMQGSPRQETGVVPEKGGVVVAGEAGIVPGEMRPPFSLKDERECAAPGGRENLFNFDWRTFLRLQITR